MSPNNKVAALLYHSQGRPGKIQVVPIKVAPAVAKAAIESGVARKTITDWVAYENQLRDRMSSQVPI